MNTSSSKNLSVCISRVWVHKSIFLTVNRNLVTLRNCVLLKTLLIGVSNASKLHTFSSLCLVAYEVKLKTMENSRTVTG